MKLAEALLERADLQKRIAQMDGRLENNAQVQEGEKPAEDPKALLKELEEMAVRMEQLVTAINLGWKRAPIKRMLRDITGIVQCVADPSTPEVFKVAESVRGALESVPKGQLEAGYCVRMNYLQIMWHVVIPQALRTAFPPLSNSVIAMLKDTSLVAEITVADMFMAAQKIVGRTYEPLWVYCEVALIYLIFSTVLTFVQRYFEKRLSAYNSRSTEAVAVK